MADDAAHNVPLVKAEHVVIPPSDEDEANNTDSEEDRSIAKEQDVAIAKGKSKIPWRKKILPKFCQLKEPVFGQRMNKEEREDHACNEIMKLYGQQFGLTPATIRNKVQQVAQQEARKLEKAMAAADTAAAAAAAAPSASPSSKGTAYVAARNGPTYLLPPQSATGEPEKKEAASSEMSGASAVKFAVQRGRESGAMLDLDDEDAEVTSVGSGRPASSQASASPSRANNNAAGTTGEQQKEAAPKKTAVPWTKVIHPLVSLYQAHTKDDASVAQSVMQQLAKEHSAKPWMQKVTETTVLDYIKKLKKVRERDHQDAVERREAPQAEANLPFRLNPDVPTVPAQAAALSHEAKYILPIPELPPILAPLPSASSAPAAAAVVAAVPSLPSPVGPPVPIAKLQAAQTQRKRARDGPDEEAQDSISRGGKAAHVAYRLIVLEELLDDLQRQAQLTTRLDEVHAKLMNQAFAVQWCIQTVKTHLKRVQANEPAAAAAAAADPNAMTSGLPLLFKAMDLDPKALRSAVAAGIEGNPEALRKMASALKVSPQFTNAMKATSKQFAETLDKSL